MNHDGGQGQMGGLERAILEDSVLPEWRLLPKPAGQEQQENTSKDVRQLQGWRYFSNYMIGRPHNHRTEMYVRNLT